MRATQHFHRGLLLSTPKEKKRNKTIYTGKLPTSKEEREIFLGFLLITTTTSMEIILTNFFGVFVRFIKHTRRKLEKDFKLAWIVQ